MCGRFYGGVEILERAAEEAGMKVRKPAGFREEPGDVTPGMVWPLLAGSDSEAFLPARWGFPGFDGRLLINARSETAAEKPTFRHLWRGSRAVAPADAYYEWDSTRQRFTFAAGDGKVLFLAGLVEESGPEKRFVILTVPAYGAGTAVHPRMPLMIPGNSLSDWLHGGEAWRDQQLPVQIIGREPGKRKEEVDDGQLSLFDSAVVWGKKDSEEG